MLDLKLKDLIYIERGALTKSECDSLIYEYDNRSSEAIGEECLHAVTNEMTKSTFKRIELTPNTDNFNLIHNKKEQIIKNWINHLESFGCFHTNTLKMSLRYSHTYRLMKYDVGGWIHPHVDWDEMVHGSCTFALNEEYEGGDFMFWNGNHKVKLNRGDVMIFPADPFWVHEVSEITKGVRYSVNSFIQSLPDKECRNMQNSIWNSGWSEYTKNEYYYPSCEENIVDQGE